MALVRFRARSVAILPPGNAALLATTKPVLQCTGMVLSRSWNLTGLFGSVDIIGWVGVELGNFVQFEDWDNREKHWSLHL